MSFDFRTIKEPGGDPLLKYVAGLQRKLSKKVTEDLVGQLDDSEDIYSDGQDVEVAVKLQRNLTGTHTFRYNKDYYVPIEPGSLVTCWLKGYNMGSFMRDFSDYDHKGEIRLGEPLLTNGDPFDYGIFDESVGIKSTALRFNRPTSPTVNSESIIVRDSPDIQITALATGFSIFMRFRAFSLANQGGLSPTLFEKIDDSTPDNGFMLQLKDDGRLICIVKQAGVTTAKETATGTITTNTVYDVWITYSTTGPTIHIYVNAVDKTLSNFTGAVNWQNDLTNTDLWIMKRGADSQGFVYGDLYDFVFYHNEKVVSQTEVNRHFTNKWSISDIPFGQVLVANYWAVARSTNPPISSFTSTSFSSASFTTA